MLHGRVVRPRGQGAVRRRNGFAKPLSVDESSIKHIPGAQVVRTGDFLGVVAPTEYEAIQAAAQLKVKWAEPPTLAGHRQPAGSRCATHDAAGQAPARIAINTGNFDAAFASAREDGLGRRYKYHYNGHAADRPGVLRRRRDARTARAIFTNTQDAYVDAARAVAGAARPAGEHGPRQSTTRARARSATASGTLRRRPGGGAHVAARRQAGAAAVHALGRARLGHYGPAQLMDIRGGVDASGKIVAFESTALRARRRRRRYATDRAAGSGDARRSRRQPARSTPTTQRRRSTTIPNRRVIGKTLPLLRATTSRRRRCGRRTRRRRRSPREQMIDELAYAAKMDPVAFRLQNIVGDDDQRALASTCSTRSRRRRQLAAEGGGVEPRRAATSSPAAASRSARYDDSPGRRRRRHRGEQEDRQDHVKHIYASQDAGLAINPAAGREPDGRAA